MGQKRITDQKTCGLFVLNVMRVMVQIITEICSLQSKKYFQNHSSVLLNFFYKKFYHPLVCNTTNSMQMSLS